jgi:hypothetical protein
MTLCIREGREGAFAGNPWARMARLKKKSSFESQKCQTRPIHVQLEQRDQSCGLSRPTEEVSATRFRRVAARNGAIRPRAGALSATGAASWCHARAPPISRHSAPRLQRTPEPVKCPEAKPQQSASLAVALLRRFQLLPSINDP